MAYLMGIDAGTTVIKAALFDEEKGVLESTSVDCTVPYTDGSFVEIDMERYWDACKKCIQVITSKSDIYFQKIKALAISSQGVTFVPVDSNGKELRKGILYYDTRAIEESARIIERFGVEELFAVTGQPVITELHAAAKILWLRNHEPEIYKKIYKILHVHDYLVFKLTGSFFCVPPVLSSSLLLDIRKMKWWHEMLEYLTLSSEQLPQIVKPGEPVGYIKRGVSRETGLPLKTVVVAGAIDQVCGMIGVGNINPGIVSESTGSVLAVHTVSDSIFDSRDSGIYSFCHTKDQIYALMGLCSTAGTALNWFKDSFCEKESNLAQESGKNVFTLIIEKAKNIPAGSDGLIMLAHLSGSGSPKPNSIAKGLFYGFRLHHQKDHFIRALLESIAYMLKSILEAFKEKGLRINEIRSFGGGSRSRLWNQIKADVCGLPLITPDFSEPGCLCAAIIPVCGSGVYKKFEAVYFFLCRNGDIFFAILGFWMAYQNPLPNLLPSSI